MTATLSFIPSYRARLPEIVPAAAGLVQAAERELDRRSDLHLAFGRVGDLQVDTAATVQVDDRHRQRMLGNRRQVVDREGEDPTALCELVLRHAITRPARQTDARLWVLHQTALETA